MKKVNYLLLSSLIAVGLAACNSDEEPFEVPVSEGAILDISVGGPSQPNHVSIDLSMDTQVAMDRSTWDLGFYTGSDFVVILNGSAEVMARKIDKTSFSELTAEDYEGLAQLMTVDAIFSNLFTPPPYPDWMMLSSDWIDDPEGDLNKTAIDMVQTGENENNIYIINRGFAPDGESRGDALLIKVTRNGSGYLIRYQVPGSSNIESTEIEKVDTHNFVFFNFDTGIVDFEPEKDSWDLAFTNHMEILDAGGGTMIPYSVQDYVVQNRNGVTIAEIEVSDGTDLLSSFESFTLADAAGLEFDDKINTIGRSWRTVAIPQDPTSVTGVRTDGFYIVKDASGNQYKLLFTGMLNNTGERGYPQITYELLK